MNWKSLTPLLLLLTFQTFAQQPSRNLHQNLDSIIIQDQRIQIPFSKQNRNITILDRAVILSLPVKSVDELLSYVSGIDVRQRGIYGAQADIGIDGGGFDETLVLLNGVKVTDPQTGHNMMNLPVSLDAIERIEVLRGAAAGKYGINALNGAINIITRQPDKTGVMAHVFTGSSFHKDTATHDLYTGYGIDAAAALVTGKTKHYISLGTTQSNGYRYNTAVHKDQIFYQNKILFGKQNNLHFMGGYVDNEYGANAFYAAPGDKESKETVRTAITGLKANIRMNDFWFLKPGISYRHSFDDYVFVRTHPEVYENKHYTNVIDATLNNSFYTAKGVFGLGLELRHEGIHSNSMGNHSRANMGIFAAYSLDFIPKTLINAALYSNYNADFGWNWMPSIDAGYELRPHFRLFANMGKGIRLPTYTDWYYAGPDNIGNPNLKPEKAWHTEAGLKYNNQKLHASASYFYRNTEDVIDWVKDSLWQPWQPQNFQQIKTDGLTLSADFRIWGSSSSENALLFGLSYTWLHPRLIKGQKNEGSGKISHYALENLRNQLSARVNVAFLQHFQVTLSGKYEQRVNYKDYFLLATRLSATFRRFNVYLDGSNLTNVQYIEAGAVPMPGSWLTLGVKWQGWK